MENREFMPIGINSVGFMGNYNGGGYKIKNLKITTQSVSNQLQSAGLFADLSDGEIHDVHIESGTIDVMHVKQVE